MIEIIDAPFDLCGRMQGSRLGPVAMHLEGLGEGLERLGRQVFSGTAVWPLDGRRSVSKLEGDRAALDAYLALKEHVAFALKQGRIPLVIGGDHSLAAGSISGALSQFGPGLAVLWIDAHVDLNRPSQSPSGNLHGMPMAALNRLADASEGELGDVWRRLLAEVVPEPGLADGRSIWLGLRDVDEGEVANLKTLPNPLALTMQDVDEHGVQGAINKIEQHLLDTGAERLWISFDVDSLDPIYAPGTGTAVRGGLTYREGHLVAERLHRFLMSPDSRVRLAGLDVVEVNPLRDQQNETARMANEWVQSLFGKRILGPINPGRTEI